MKKLLLIAVIGISLNACKKEDSAYCYQVVDCLGNELEEKCSMNKSQMDAYMNKMYGSYSCKNTYYRK